MAMTVVTIMAEVNRKIRLSRLRPSLLHVKPNSFPSVHIHLPTVKDFYNSLLVYICASCFNAHVIST